MKCPNPNCNTKNLPDEARYCPNCGAELLLPAMVIKSCKVTPKSVQLGEECKIQWQGEFVKHVIIDKKTYTQKSITIQPKHSQTISVQFVGIDESTVTKEVKVSVVVPQPQIEITAPEYAKPNDEILIKWKTKFVDKVTIGNKSFNANDKVSLVHEEGKTICEILFHGVDGSVIPKIVKVRKALPANVESCILEPEYISERESTVVKWTGSNIVKWKVNEQSYRSSAKESWLIPFTSDTDIKVSFCGEDGNVIEKTLTPKIFKVNFCKTDQQKIALGESVTISWDAQHTKSVTIFGKKQTEKGSYTWSPTEIGTEICQVEFIGKNGAKIIEKRTINVIPKPQIIKFELVGHNFRWDTISMEGCTINGKVYHTRGIQLMNDAFINADKLLLDCWDWRGNHYTKEILPQIIQFTASQQTLYEGEESTLSWTTFGMHKVVLNGVVRATNSTMSIPITNNQIKLECWDKEDRYYSHTLDFNVVPVPEVNLYAVDTNITQGNSTTIRWNCKNVQNLKLNRDSIGISGSKTVRIEEHGTKWFTLSGEDLVGNALKKKKVKILVQKKMSFLEFIGLMLFSAILPGFNPNRSLGFLYNIW